MNKHLRNNLLFFDGDCVLCNKSIRFIHFLDSKRVIFFSPLQSELGLEIQNQLQLPKFISTVVYHHKGILYSKSSAVIHCLSDTNWYFKPILLLLLIPKFIRDKVYDFIAENRKKIFRNQSCSIASESLRKQVI
jgi:predicted DCC family thiol-disulfide oxidoreductase YuxK